MIQFDPLSLRSMLPIPWLIALMISFVLGFLANDSSQDPEALKTHLADECDSVDQVGYKSADYAKAMALLKDLNQQLLKNYDAKKAYDKLNDEHSLLIEDKAFMQEKNLQLQQQVDNLSAIVDRYTLKNEEFSLAANRTRAVKNNHVFALLEVSSDRVQVNFDDIGYSLKSGEKIKFQEGKEQCTLKLIDISTFAEKATFTMECS